MASRAVIVDYEKVAAGDETEIATLFKACHELGFFYLCNHGVDPEPMFEMGKETFEMPLEELLRFEQGDGGMSAGYKRAGSTNVDAKGNVDSIQFINVAKDDALAFPDVKQRSYPSATTARMSTVTAFVRRSDEVLQTLMAALEPHLGLPAGTLAKLHREGEISGSEARTILKPAPGQERYIPEGVSENGEPSAAIGAHCDFGSFSMLHGRGTGGLQVLPPGSPDWQYIKPLAGHAVCNVGDTLAVYSGGILRSNIHRVVPPPAPQNRFERWSQVYFLRPAFQNELYPLSDLSPEIVGKHASQDAYMSKLERGQTAGDWFKRRIMLQRAKNRTEDSWKQSRGTEHTPGKD